MKTLINIVFAFLFVLVSCSQKTDEVLNREEFMDPPSSAGIYAWWHWLDNAITKEGITRDLEAMKQQGIAGATILNVGLFDEKDMGVPPVVFGTDQWYEMFRWALQEADRLGITIGAHNCDGWSTSGGPWITPGMSMKQYIWSKTYVEGGRPLDTVLAKPAGLMDYYEDAAVVAYPANDFSNSFQILKPQIKVNKTVDGAVLADGNPFSHINMNADEFADISFSEAFPADRVAIHIRIASSWESLKDFVTAFEILKSADGKNFTHVADIKVRGANETVITDIPETEAKYFRILLKKNSEVRYYSGINLAETELLKNGERPTYSATMKFHLEKTASTRPEEVSDIFINQPLSDPQTPVLSSGVMDLTGKMDAGGKLKWDVPEGRWVIIRFGYTTTGSVNAPATKAGRGLECDKMDTNALNLHFSSFPEKLIGVAGDLAGNTFKYLFIDSWECNFQNWTQNFSQEFEVRRGYSLIPWIPVLCGETENSTEETESFLQDFRKTIADLIEENYYRHYTELCHRKGMDLHAEVIYGGIHYPPLDVLRSNRYMDVPMWEFWTNQDSDGFVHYMPVQSASFDKPMYASVVYNKPVVPSEAYTGFAHYSESPWDLKLYGDRAYCAGINRMVLHSYVHQPTEKKPGMTLGPFASHFNRHNTWWDHVSGWFTYQARVQYILQQGQVVSDILSFIGDRLPEYEQSNDLNAIPTGFNVQLCNLDILLNHCMVKNGCLQLDNGLSYKVLLLPDITRMEYSTLQRIATLISEGATVSGPKPSEVFSYQDREQNNENLKKLADEIWGEADGINVMENKYGKGKVIWGRKLEDILAEMNIRPDLRVVKSDPVNLLFIHKKISTTEIYFLVNQEDVPIHTECIFRIAGKSPEIWNPQTGVTVHPAIYREEEDGLTRIPVSFQPKESLFVVFSDEASDEHIISVEQNGQTLFPMEPFKDIRLPEITSKANTFCYIPENPDEYILSSNLDREYNLPAGEVNEKMVIRDFTGMISFEGEGKVPEPVAITNFQYWTGFKEKDIQYFSGKAKYTVQFSIPPDFLTGNDSLELSVGGIKATGEISLNGKELAYIWRPGQKVNISGILKQGDNTLEITVANVYRNRLIGDLVQYGEIKSLWTTSPVQDFLNKEMKLQESGIAGPVVITRIRPVYLAGKGG